MLNFWGVTGANPPEFCPSFRSVFFPNRLLRNLFGKLAIFWRSRVVHNPRGECYWVGGYFPYIHHWNLSWIKWIPKILNMINCPWYRIDPFRYQALRWMSLPPTQKRTSLKFRLKEALHFRSLRMLFSTPPQKGTYTTWHLCHGQKSL